jgi:hypothetical protein
MVGITLPGSFSFSRDFSENLEVIYSYSAIDPIIDGMTIPYSFSDGSVGTDVLGIGRAAFTQKIMNNMPYWMDMRLDRDSAAQDLVHSWGFNLEEVNNQYVEYRNEQFLSTANPYLDTHGGVSELSFQEDRAYTPEFRNFLYNSSFSLKSIARTNRPEGWAVDRVTLNDISFDYSNSIFGDNAIKLSGTAALKQSLEIKKLSGNLTFSIYAKTIIDTGLSTVDRFDPDTAGLLLIVRYADSTVSSYGVGFPKNTGNKLVRASLTVNIAKETKSVEVIIVNRSGYDFSIDLPMLEEAASPSQWTSGIRDYPIHISSLNAKSVAAVGLFKGTESSLTSQKLEVTEVSTEVEFADITIPTRIERIYPSTDPGHSIDLALGRQITAEFENLPVMWSASDGKLKEESLTTPDVFSIVDIRDAYKAENGSNYLDEYTAGSVKATTVLRDLVIAVTKETYLGKTANYLKFIKPTKLSYEDGYVQSLSDLEIPIDLNPISSNAIPEEVIRIGLCKDIPFCIFIDTSLDRRFYFKLHYDYCYADFRVRKLFCREYYLKENAYLQII